ncbi:MAG: hypothetical protein QM530_08415 [Phycisphaerales bacterium]|nr:hypothetical protein [Phycisphaerales bacterium]
MNKVNFSFFFAITLAFICSGSSLFAQQVNLDSLKKARQVFTEANKQAIQKRSDSLAQIRKYKESIPYKDSVSKARNAQIDAIRNVRTNAIDSANKSRKRILDSTIAIRKTNTQQLQQRLKAKTDSLNLIRKYKESRLYTDSVIRARNKHIDSLRNSRTHFFDSLKTIRKKTIDSTIAVRRHASDSLKAKQKIKADSIALIRKYKESRRYRDSVQVMRQSRLDSIRIARKVISDKIIKERKDSLAKLAKLRKEKMDALNKLSKQKADSLKNAQAKRAETLAKQKEIRDNTLKTEQKRKEDKMKLKFELKIKKKHEAWSNEKMLKKKWTLIRQGFQNTYTRYNYFFNAKRKMQEANLNMQRRKKDNYEQLIELFPFDPNVDSSVFASDMDTIIRKASVGIQIHDPRTKWADDLYLLMGQSYYFKGDYERATTTFKYVIGMKNRHLTKKKTTNRKDNDAQLVQKEPNKFKKLIQHRPAHNDAILWLTRTYTDSKKEADGEAILDLLDANEKVSDEMKNKIALEKANLHIRKGAYKEASKQLITVSNSKTASKYIRQRASYLNGQLLYTLGYYDSAANSFKKTIALHPSIEMDFYARKNAADAIAQRGGDQTKSIASLKSLLKDGKYTPYYEQVYYILGKLSANNNNTEEALSYYRKSLVQPKTTKKQKAITYASMGNIQYSLGQYNLAKKSYDSASYFAKEVGNNKEIITAMRRGKSLDKIEDPYYTLHDQDSLLKLVAMTEKEQKAVVKNYLKYLEKQKEDSIVNAQVAATSGSLANSSSGTGSWYFSSTVAVQQGYNDFKRKWGNRPLADNWRRASSSNFGGDVIATENDSNDTETNNGSEINETTLLAAIPKTDAQLNAIRKKIRRAYVNLGAAYIKDLEEYKEGLATLDSLNKKYPDHEFLDEVMYLRYTAALRQNKLEEAELIRQKLIDSFPKSNFAEMLTNNSIADSSVNTKKIESVSNYYTNTYQLANDRQYQEVIKRTIVAKRLYSDETYIRKFRVLEAMSYVSIGNYKKADTLLSTYVKEYPSDSLRPWIDAIYKYANELKIADSVAQDSLKKATISSGKDTSVSVPKSDTTITAKPTKPEVIDEYQYNTKQTHYCVFVFGVPDVKVVGFRSGLSDYSKLKFSELTLNSEIEVLNAEVSLVITKEFGNAGQAKIFMNAAKKEALLFRDFESNNYQYFIISEPNISKLKSEKKLANYLKFYQKNYK